MQNIKYVFLITWSLVLVMCVIFLLPAVSSADTLKFKDGSQVKGVLLKEEEDRVVFTTEKGDEVIKKEIVDRITYDTDEENTLLLAEYAEKADAIKAFYLFEKAYRINPESEKAMQGMTRLQDNVYKASSGRALAVNYERYQTSVDDKLNENDILNQNAVETEKLQKDLGIILATKDFRQAAANTYYTKIKVVDVVPDSRAYEAGVRLGDYLVNIEGYAGGRMGLYDAVSLLAQHSSGDVSIAIERKVDLFVPQDNSASSVFELTGFNVDEGASGLLVIAVEDGLSAFASRIRKGDIILSADYGSKKLATKADLDAAIRGAMPGNVNLTIRKKIDIK